LSIGANSGVHRGKDILSPAASFAPSERGCRLFFELKMKSKNFLLVE
jgi:hypothetical protein